MPELPDRFDPRWQGKKIRRDREAGRKYKTNSAAWRRIRAVQLQLHPLCKHCRKKGRATAASHVDHIDGDSWNNSRDNLQSLCASCHSRKTVRQDGGFGNPRG